MKVLVDTSVWSLALRRPESFERLRDHLQPDLDEQLETAAFERAAAPSSRSRCTARI